VTRARLRPFAGAGARTLLLAVCGVVASVRLAAAQCPDGTPPPCAAQRRAAPAPNSVAVLIFENAARDTSLDWLGDGLAEEVATELGAAAGVTVRGAGIVRNAVGVAGHDPRRIAQLVSVRYVVEGSYRRVGTRVRVSARLLALPAGDQRWGRVYDRPRDSLATLSDAIAYDLAAALGASARRSARRPPDPQAYDAYQRGRSFFLRNDYATARSLFEQAVQRDSTFALAWAGLANAWGELADLLIAPLEAYPRVREAARRALALDSSVASAYVPLAWAAGSLDRDCRAGERLLDRAIAFDSVLPDAWAVRGEMLACQGRSAEALDAVRHAWELDSLSSLTGNYLLDVNWLTESQRAPEVFALVRQRLSPSYAQGWEAHFAQQHGDCAAAERLLRPSGASNRWLSWYVRALACLGRLVEADSVVRAAIADTVRRYVNPVAVARGLTALGDRDRAIRWLERAADERTWWVMKIHNDPELEPLRSDPRFEALERRLGLQP
jgi:TolB-like protein